MTSNSISEISKPIQSELASFESIFREAMKSKVGLVDLIARYIIRQKGKKIRPLLVLLSSKIFGEINERSYRGAVLVELLHSATLIHDDVVDNSDKRRNFWSINYIFKNKIAVLMGDYLLSRGLFIAVEGKDFDFLGVITDAVKRMSEGELLQIQKTRKLDIDEITYFKIISDKTSSLLETCCQIGAMSTSSLSSDHEAMKNYGHNLGLAFQIRDDILDYDGKFSLIGKPIGGDIKEKKITLPLIFALNQVNQTESSKVKSLLKKPGKDGVQKIIDFVHRNGGIEYSISVAKKYSQLAKDSLANFSHSECKSSLESLVDFVVERKN